MIRSSRLESVSLVNRALVILLDKMFPKYKVTWFLYLISRQNKMTNITPKVYWMEKRRKFQRIIWNTNDRCQRHNIRSLICKYIQIIIMPLYYLKTSTHKYITSNGATLVAERPISMLWQQFCPWKACNLSFARKMNSLFQYQVWKRDISHTKATSLN